VVLMATKEKMGPLPLRGSPMRVTLLVHVNVVPVTGLVKNTAAVLSRSQRIWLFTGSTVGRGLMVMVNVRGVPEQVSPLLRKDGVTVMVAVTGAALLLATVNGGMFPVPEVARPMEGVLLVQLKFVPGMLPVKLIAVVLLPLQSN